MARAYDDQGRPVKKGGRLITCPQCAGTGRDDGRGGMQRTADNRCTTCDGNGVVWQ